MTYQGGLSHQPGEPTARTAVLSQGGQQGATGVTRATGGGEGRGRGRGHGEGEGRGEQELGGCRQPVSIFLSGKSGNEPECLLTVGSQG